MNTANGRTDIVEDTLRVGEIGATARVEADTLRPRLKRADPVGRSLGDVAGQARLISLDGSETPGHLDVVLVEPAGGFFVGRAEKRTFYRPFFEAGENPV